MSNLLSGMSGMSGMNGMNDSSIGGEGLKASQDALQMLDKTSAATTRMNAEAQSKKMETDTVNSIMNGYVDSANKANNAATSSGKAINY